MFLPENEKAVVDIAKLRDYCLNPNHPVGKHKAKVFASALGFGIEDAGRLRQMLLNAALLDQVIVKEKDQYGQRYQIDFVINLLIFNAVGGQLGDVVVIRSAWIVLTNETLPRLTTCYVL